MIRAAPRPPPRVLADAVVGNQAGAVQDNSFTIFVVDTELGTDSTISGYSDTSVWEYHTSAVVGDEIVAMPGIVLTIFVVNAELGTHSTISD